MDIIEKKETFSLFQLYVRNHETIVRLFSQFVFNPFRFSILLNPEEFLRRYEASLVLFSLFTFTSKLRSTCLVTFL